jgi:hypothetical protein
MKTVCATILAVLSIPVMAAEKVVEYDEFRVSGRLRDKRPFELFISREPYNRAKHPDIRLDGSHPSYVVSALTLTIAGRQVEIPEHVFRYLADPQIHCGPFLMQDGKTIYLYIRGGDCAGSYTERLTIRGSEFISAATITQPGRRP